MKFEIYLTNGERYALDIGGTRLNEYNTLEELFKALKIILKLSKVEK